MDRRRHDRIQLNHLLADISDGRGFFSGTVADLSRTGIQLSDVPKRLDKQTKDIWITLSDNRITSYNVCYTKLLRTKYSFILCLAASALRLIGIVR